MDILFSFLIASCPLYLPVLNGCIRCVVDLQQAVADPFLLLADYFKTEAALSCLATTVRPGMSLDRGLTGCTNLAPPLEEFRGSDP